MPISAYFMAREVKKMVEELDERVILLELEVKDLKKKLKKNGIK